MDPNSRRSLATGQRSGDVNRQPGTVAYHKARRSPRLIKDLRDTILRAAWVFSYAAIILVFRLLQRVEGRSSGGSAK